MLLAMYMSNLKKKTHGKERKRNSQLKSNFLT
jgi:hypothetical protein